MRDTGDGALGPSVENGNSHSTLVEWDELGRNQAAVTRGRDEER